MTLSLQAQLALQIDDNELLAEEMLDFIYKRYKLNGSSDRVIELFDNWLFFICEKLEPSIAFHMCQIALRDMAINMEPSRLKHFLLFHYIVGPYIAEQENKWPDTLTQD